MVNPELDTVPIVPDDPPAAGPDRALDPPPLEPGAPEAPAAGRACAEGGAEADEDEDDVARPMETPVTAQISAAATIQALRLFDGNRPTRDQRGCFAWTGEADQSGDGA
jgi:hypothetical protein